MPCGILFCSFNKTIKNGNASILNFVTIRISNLCFKMYQSILGYSTDGWQTCPKLNMRKSEVLVCSASVWFTYVSSIQMYWFIKYFICMSISQFSICTTLVYRCVFVNTVYYMHNFGVQMYICKSSFCHNNVSEIIECQLCFLLPSVMDVVTKSNNQRSSILLLKKVKNEIAQKKIISEIYVE